MFSFSTRQLALDLRAGVVCLGVREIPQPERDWNSNATYATCGSVPLQLISAPLFQIDV